MLYLSLVDSFVPVWQGDQKCLKLCLRHIWMVQSTLPLNTTGPFAGLKLIKESIKKDTGCFL